MKMLSFFLVLTLIPQVVFALTLEQMQRAALENRALVKRFETEIEKGAENIRIARGEYYPSLDILYNTFTIDEATLTERRENSIFSGIVTWNIFAGFKDKYSIKSAEARKEVDMLRLSSIEQDIQLSVALRYLAVFFQQSRQEVAEDTFKTLEGLYLDSKNRYDVGLLDRNAVLKFKVDFDNADLAVKREKADLEKALYLLAREVDQTISYPQLNFNEFQVPPALEDKEDYEQVMLRSRSELKVLEGLAVAAAYNVDAEYGDYYPQFELVGRYRKYDDSLLNGRGEFTDEELRAELVMSYNLFEGFIDEAEIARAKAEVRSLKYDLNELQNSLKTELKNLFVDYDISLANVAVAREDITFAEENLRITELKYKEGLQRQLDLLDAVSNLTRAQSNYVAVVRTVFENYFRIIRMIEGFPGRS
ncbi:MAG: TolC family protein [Desulfobacterales bacterium]|nr:TolC family protein [Deltaproteobacteria bacterium]NNK94094.1 TolC family protein [Desulfobacterales bacterium]